MQEMVTAKGFAAAERAKYPLKKPIFLERNRAGAPVFTGFDF
ncbi:hypothetical protein GSU75_03952 [Pseudomonas savastanoi pv. phaseolicola]|nr:hypothetical protein [Pseudomonas savastanoi pv. phaseolicola]